VDVKTFLNDWTNWTNADFEKARPDANYQLLQYSWIEQRAFLDNAIVALGNHPLAQRILDAFSELVAEKPDLRGFKQQNNLSQIFTTKNFQIKFDENSGAVIYFVDNVNKVNWASTDRPLGLFQYQVLTPNNYSNYLSTYGYCDWLTDCPWFELVRGEILFCLWEGFWEERIRGCEYGILSCFVGIAEFVGRFFGKG
jgi:hypothetical protein